MAIVSSYLENWLALYHCDKVGPITFKKYLEHDPLLQRLPRNIKPNWLAVQEDLTWLETQPYAHILTLEDDLYPNLLKNISSPPPLLYLLGDASCLNKPQLAMIGSRKCSVLGSEQAEYFAQQFVDLGLIVTSGLAIGIDGASHRGALSRKHGKTIAVLAHGMDMIYPSRHKNLSEQIIMRGCLVSEFSLKVKPVAGHFPRRNRIISGLSLGTLVVEADINSGSLVTAKYAMEQGREVFAIPGPINMARVKGCHQLIKQGAKLVESVDDVLEELSTLLKYAIRDKYACDGPIEPIQVNLSARQQQLLDFIDYDSTCVDVIVGRSGLASNIVGAVLLELELHGVITAVPGGYARKLG